MGVLELLQDPDLRVEVLLQPGAELGGKNGLDGGI
jgi:hypothetical protein